MKQIEEKVLTIHDNLDDIRILLGGPQKKGRVNEIGNLVEACLSDINFIHGMISRKSWFSRMLNWKKKKPTAEKENVNSIPF